MFRSAPERIRKIIKWTLLFIGIMLLYWFGLVVDEILLGTDSHLFNSAYRKAGIPLVLPILGFWVVVPILLYRHWKRYR